MSNYIRRSSSDTSSECTGNGSIQRCSILGTLDSIHNCLYCIIANDPEVTAYRLAASRQGRKWLSNTVQELLHKCVSRQDIGEFCGIIGHAQKIWRYTKCVFANFCFSTECGSYGCGVSSEVSGSAFPGTSSPVPFVKGSLWFGRTSIAQTSCRSISLKAIKRPRDESGQRGSVRESDWPCPNCLNVNFAWRQYCNIPNCNTQKPEETKIGQKLRDYWECPNCGNQNYLWRVVCNTDICQAHRPMGYEEELRKICFCVSKD